MELLKIKKTQGAQSLRCRKHFPKLFEDMKKGSPILEKIVMKFFMNFKFKLDKFYYLTHGTLSAALSFCYIYFWRMTLCQQFFPFLKIWKFLMKNLTHENFSVAFSFLWRMTLCRQFFVLFVMFVMFFWKGVKCL